MNLIDGEWNELVDTLEKEQLDYKKWKSGYDDNAESYFEDSETSETLVEYDVKEIGELRCEINKAIGNGYSKDTLSKVLFFCNKYKTIDTQRYENISLVNYMM